MHCNEDKEKASKPNPDLEARYEALFSELQRLKPIFDACEQAMAQEALAEEAQADQSSISPPDTPSEP